MSLKIEESIAKPIRESMRKLRKKAMSLFDVPGVDEDFAIDGPEPLAVARVGCH